jgi:TPR repeat protein
MLRWVLVVVFVAGLGFLPNLARASDDPVARLDEMILAKDFDNAVKVAREAAEAGNVEVQFWHGVGLTQNYLEALRWTTLAALSGHEKAFAARKIILPTVDAPNWPKVLDWSRQRLQKNAESGFNPALFAMAKSYSPDFGFENPVEEYYWASLAVAIGDTSARKRRDELTKKLPITDAAKAQDRAAAWIEKFRSGKPPG